MTNAFRSPISSGTPAPAPTQTPVAVPAAPYPLALRLASTALVVIDMQRDFLEPGGFGAMLGNDVALLRTTIAPCRRLLTAAHVMLERHRAEDTKPVEADLRQKEIQRITRLQTDAAQLRQWLTAHPEDRKGSQGAIRKSNRTDNESAKMATRKGVIQGDTGVAAVDAKHQIIVDAKRTAPVASRNYWCLRSKRSGTRSPMPRSSPRPASSPQMPVTTVKPISSNWLT